VSFATLATFTLPECESGLLCSCPTRWFQTDWCDRFDVGWAPNSSSMRILLKHTRTQLYLRSLGNWTMNPYEAHDFQHSQRAADFARENGLTGVQIAVKFLDSPHDEVFPLSAAANASSQPTV
jgi:hypothetical protein